MYGAPRRSGRHAGDRASRSSAGSRVSSRLEGWGVMDDGARRAARGSRCEPEGIVSKVELRRTPHGQNQRKWPTSM
ncbi:hypothetical protein BBAD15_g11669 [Beauveria bassiana D1-5]|uniref:Uncharacterized protein n=1 Tax=Beauveria bassiana D1-5 TaxID=1245745 RepID=A0A0A2VAK8_BEABA|nr:hypothetical protein BBAD15_g11669 [Beauveria bassiana D1-5]